MRAVLKYLVFAYAPDGFAVLLAAICGWRGGIKRADPHLMPSDGGKSGE